MLSFKDCPRSVFGGCRPDIENATKMATNVGASGSRHAKHEQIRVLGSALFVQCRDFQHVFKLKFTSISSFCKRVAKCAARVSTFAERAASERDAARE